MEQKLHQQNRRYLQGEVVSNKMDKSIVVVVKRRKMHPLYKKYISRTKKIMVQDSENIAQQGDIVRIGETRPLSKKKHWELISIVKKVQ